MAPGDLLEAGRGERAHGSLFVDPLVDQVVAGVLQQEGDAAGALYAAPRRLEQRGRVTQQRRLARAVSPHQREGFAGAHA